MVGACTDDTSRICTTSLNTEAASTLRLTLQSYRAHGNGYYTCQALHMLLSPGLLVGSVPSLATAVAVSIEQLHSFEGH